MWEPRRRNSRVKDKRKTRLEKMEKETIEELKDILSGRETEISELLKAEIKSKELVLTKYEEEKESLQAKLKILVNYLR